MVLMQTFFLGVLHMWWFCLLGVMQYSLQDVQYYNIIDSMSTDLCKIWHPNNYNFRSTQTNMGLEIHSHRSFKFSQMFLNAYRGQ